MIQNLEGGLPTCPRDRQGSRVHRALESSGNTPPLNSWWIQFILYTARVSSVHVRVKCVAQSFLQEAARGPTASRSGAAPSSGAAGVTQHTVPVRGPEREPQQTAGASQSSSVFKRTGAGHSPHPTCLRAAPSCILGFPASVLRCPQGQDGDLRMLKKTKNHTLRIRQSLKTPKQDPSHPHSPESLFSALLTPLTPQRWQGRVRR